jgi:chromosome segregation ATPase
MMLELLAEHHQSFADVNKRMDATDERNAQRFAKIDDKVSDLGSQLRTAQAEIKRAVETVEDLKTKVNTMEERLEGKIAEVRKETEAVKVRTGALETRVAGIEPQIAALQEEVARQEEQNKARFKEVHAKVDNNWEKHEAHIRAVEEKGDQTERRLAHLEEAFRKADIEGLTKKVNKHQEQIEVMEGTLEDHTGRIGAAEARAVQLQAQVDGILPFVAETYLTKGDAQQRFAAVEQMVGALERKVEEQYLTKEEYLAAQDAMARQMNDFVLDRLDAQRQEIQV